jgi:hypothetical protein
MRKESRYDAQNAMGKEGLVKTVRIAMGRDRRIVSHAAEQEKCENTDRYLIAIYMP